VIGGGKLLNILDIEKETIERALESKLNCFSHTKKCVFSSVLTFKSLHTFETKK